MKTMLTIAAAGLAFAFTGAAHAQGAQDLMKSNGCMNCHDVSAKKVGPSFKDIAAKFKGKADAEKMLDPPGAASSKGRRRPSGLEHRPAADCRLIPQTV
jgi:cytochrome c